LACDLRSNSVLAELPLKGGTFGSKLNGFGAFSGDIPRGDPSLDQLDLIGASVPGRTALYVDRDGVLIWGGIIWTRNFRKSQARVSLGGNEFFSYFHDKQEIRTTKVYNSADQLFIARDLINYAQGKTGGNIGVIVGSETSGVYVDYTWYPWDAKKLGQAIADQASHDNGYDFAIDVAYDSALVPRKYLRLSYPRRGRRFTQTALLFEFPGNIEDYDYPEDGTRMANSVLAQGQGSQENQLSSVAVDTSKVDAGYPLLEEVRLYTSNFIPASLNRHAAADLKAFAKPVLTPQLTVRADMDPVLGSYICGDEIRVRITDEWFNTGRAADGSYLGPGLDDYFRIIGMDVLPPDDSRDESVRLTLGPTV